MLCSFFTQYSSHNLDIILPPAWNAGQYFKLDVTANETMQLEVRKYVYGYKNVAALLN